ncbi:AzlD domain-containing protein [Rhodococcus sp. WS1]|uniref:AzlD domain-containing protein n=1 Tax=Rhodococcus TaxID=1827 RepID=UPI00114458DD|nr:MULTISPECIES: AzlD domain-containing protein [Rhodococcus]MBF7734764.1 AzlD domain-containing protein [Rhodococcus erythropolis]MCJ0898650.1 AzlD domain-containing protein [Rhodococcus sp. ARC_M13]MCZ4644357.1 AzlD domain-containing protein [Rhodococcus erythropolis]ROZ53643.1 AzlD domain-containing protein [Rhodococcus sp. WS1]TQC34426.1 AzlD domain-containing protein [Rhodococcus sp. WS7]
MNTASVWIGIVVFACGSYALRASGVLLRARVKLSSFAEKTLDRAVVVLLLAVVATSTIFIGHDVAGPARMLGVVAGGICAWLKAPLVLVVIAAAGTTALLRLSGVS